MRSKLLKIRWVKGSLIAVAAIVVTTAILLPFRTYLNLTEVALTYILVVLVSSTLFGNRPGLLASVAGGLAFNFFFIPPVHTLTISRAGDWTSFLAFLATALIAGQLSAYARRRAAESQAKQAEIEKLYEELKNAFEQASEAEALRRSEKLKSALLDAVTHDLRTPLTAIKASVTTLMNEPADADLDDESRKEFLDIINEETDRLNDFIDGMVGIAKVEADAVDTEKSLYSVDEIIGNALDRARKALVDRTVEVAIPNDLPQIDINAASVTQVIFTLLDNAAKYSPPESRIRVSAHVTAAAKVRIVIEDQGTGIPKVERERVFDKFARLDDDARTGTGLGLGLTIARGIIESQDGRIWIEDGSRDFVTRIVVELPTESAAIETPNAKVAGK